jgi:hypothetical protein
MQRKLTFIYHLNVLRQTKLADKLLALEPSGIEMNIKKEIY